MSKINLEGSYAPTKQELLATAVFLDELVESWPKHKANKATQAVKRFSRKLNCVCDLHDLKP